MAVKLSPLEKETIIVFNESESEAHVYTCKASFIKKLNKYCDQFPDLYKQIRSDEISKSYIIPKKYIRFGCPQPNKGQHLKKNDNTEDNDD